jgi:GAF domain-containing protein
VFQTGRQTRADDYAETSGQVGEYSRGFGIRASVGVPITVEARLWGVVIAASREEPLSADTEARPAGFTELVATVIANAEAQSALTASPARSTRRSPPSGAASGLTDVCVFHDSHG